MNKYYHFVLVLSNLSESNEQIEDALFEAGCDDALLIFRDKVPYLDFDRQATSLENALSSAIQQVKSTNLGIKVLRIECDEKNLRGF
jgi:hypothetical protein